MARPVHVRIMSDYGCQTPVWAEDGAVQGLVISPDLRALLEAWQEFFEEHFHYDHGWDAEERRRQYALAGEALRALVAAELGTGYSVELDLWPVGAGIPGPGRRAGEARL